MRTKCKSHCRSCEVPMDNTICDYLGDFKTASNRCSVWVLKVRSQLPFFGGEQRTNLGAAAYITMHIVKF